MSCVSGQSALICQLNWNSMCLERTSSQQFHLTFVHTTVHWCSRQLASRSMKPSNNVSLDEILFMTNNRARYTRTPVNECLPESSLLLHSSVVDTVVVDDDAGR